MDTVLALAPDPAAWVALLTLITMEVVLGIDNLIFIAILTNKLPEHQRAMGRRIGLALALVLRLALLGSIAVVVKLTAPVFIVFDHGFSWRVGHSRSESRLLIKARSASWGRKPSFCGPLWLE